MILPSMLSKRRREETRDAQSTASQTTLASKRSKRPATVSPDCCSWSANPAERLKISEMLERDTPDGKHRRLPLSQSHRLAPLRDPILEVPMRLAPDRITHHTSALVQFTQMLVREEALQPSASYLSNAHCIRAGLTLSMRSLLIEWALKVCHAFALRSSTCGLVINVRACMSSRVHIISHHVTLGHCGSCAPRALHAMRRACLVSQ